MKSENAPTPSSSPIRRVGGIVLCGGDSGRMGRSKASLPFGGGKTMLGRVVRVCAQVVDPICVVGSPGQTLPDLPESVVIASDVIAGHGPLQGLSAGLDALKDRCDAAFVCSCDLPLLLPAFIQTMIEQLGEHELAIPIVHGRRHPLSAVYRMSALQKVDRLLKQDRRALRDLISICDVWTVDQPTLQQVDPDLISLRNVNTQEDYDKALRDWLATHRSVNRS